MSQYSRFLILLFCVFGMYACSKDPASSFEEPTTPEATFSSIQNNVLSKSCATSGCHNGSQFPNLSAGAAYNNTVNVRSSRGIDYIEPGNPNSSYLYLKIIGSNISGSRMPEGQAPLPSAISDTIKVWIQKGAQND